MLVVNVKNITGEQRDRFSHCRQHIMCLNLAHSLIRRVLFMIIFTLLRKESDKVPCFAHMPTLILVICHPKNVGKSDISESLAFLKLQRLTL